MSYSLRVMDIHPGPRHLGQLVVHVVGLVQEQLQHKAMFRPRHCYLSHLMRKMYTLLTIQESNNTSLPETAELKEKQLPYLG